MKRRKEERARNKVPSLTSVSMGPFANDTDMLCGVDKKGRVWVRVLTSEDGETFVASAWTCVSDGSVDRGTAADRYSIPTTGAPPTAVRRRAKRQ